jgi:hypothetical protein
LRSGGLPKLIIVFDFTLMPIVLSFFSDFFEFLDEIDSLEFFEPTSSLLLKLSWLQDPSD